MVRQKIRNWNCSFTFRTCTSYQWLRNKISPKLGDSKMICIYYLEFSASQDLGSGLGGCIFGQGVSWDLKMEPSYGWQLHPQSMAQKHRAEAQCFLWPNLGGHTPFPMLYAGGHMKQTWFNVGGDQGKTTRKWRPPGTILQAGITLRSFLHGNINNPIILKMMHCIFDYFTTDGTGINGHTYLIPWGNIESRAQLSPEGSWNSHWALKRKINILHL